MTVKELWKPCAAYAADWSRRDWCSAVDVQNAHEAPEDASKRPYFDSRHCVRCKAEC